MAALDADVAELLLALLATPVAPRALAAIQRILEESEEDTTDGVRRSGRPQSRWDQLRIAEEVIAGGIKREIVMARRLREIAPQLGVETISIVPVTAEEAAAPLAISLFERERDLAGHVFINTLAEVMRELRQRWEVSGGG